MFQEVCLPSVRHLHFHGVPWLQLSGKLCSLKVQIPLKNLIWQGNIKIFFTEVQATGQRLKDACLHPPPQWLCWVQSALAPAEAGAGLERGVLLGGKPSTSTPTQPWSWLCTSPPSNVSDACSAAGALTQECEKERWIFRGTRGAAPSAVCSHSSESEWFPRGSSCVTALLLLQKSSSSHQGCDPVSAAAQNAPTWKHLCFLHQYSKSPALSGLALCDVEDGNNEGCTAGWSGF